MQPIIMIQIADPTWTLEAVHCACRMARQEGVSEIVLMEMISVQHTQWLGTELGYVHYSDEDRARYADYKATIDDYGLVCVSSMFQYSTWVEGTLQAAAYADAKIVFAPKPKCLLSSVARFQTWQLKRQLHIEGRTWIDEPIYAALPEVENAKLVHPAASY